MALEGLSSPSTSSCEPSRAPEKCHKTSQRIQHPMIWVIVGWFRMRFKLWYPRSLTIPMTCLKMGVGHGSPSFSSRGQWDTGSAALCDEVFHSVRGVGVRSVPWRAPCTFKGVSPKVARKEKRTHNSVLHPSTIKMIRSHYKHMLYEKIWAQWMSVKPTLGSSHQVILVTTWPSIIPSIEVCVCP